VVQWLPLVAATQAMTSITARGTDRNTVSRPCRRALALCVGAAARHGADVLASLREAADLVDRILRGAKPAALRIRTDEVIE
jgi:hypothetical protein